MLVFVLTFRSYCTVVNLNFLSCLSLENFPAASESRSV